MTTLRRLTVPSIDRRTLLGIVLASTAAILVLIVTRAPSLTPVLVAGDAVTPGITLEDAAIEVRMVADAGGLVVGDDLGELAGWTVAVPIGRGEPLTPSLLRPPGMGTSQEMAIALPAAQAVMGRIGPGDRIDVYATSSRPGGESSTVLVASDLVVLEAVIEDRTRDVGLVVSVDGETAGRIAAALHTAEIDLVRRPGP